jgi:Ca2+-binding EF-hand superfamily protein
MTTFATPNVHILNTALRKTAGFIAIAAVAAIGMIAAEHASAEGNHAKIDANKDGNITRAEAANHPKLLQHFDQIDTNKDGVLSKEERMAFAQAHKGEAMKKMDGNGDGKISREEAAKHPRLAKHFDQIDTNKDGVLSTDELQAFRAAHGKK